MAYKEPYPVITKWPSASHLPEGTRRCFHYSLTLDQINNNRLAAHKAMNNSSIGETVFFTAFGLATLAIEGPSAKIVGISSLLITAMQSTSGYRSSSYNARLFGVWDSIYSHMLKGKYKRVTISQVIRLKRANYNPYEHNKYTEYWVLDGLPRVPVESYYLKR